MEDIGRLVQSALAQKRRLELDNEAFSELVLRFQDMAFGYACSVVGDPALAQDVVQESFLVAWRRLEQLTVPEAFPGWFRTIIRTRALVELRRPRTSRLDSTEEAMLASSERPPVEGVIRNETAREIREAIGRLPQRLRAPVLLHYIDGYRLSDVADFLEIEVGTVKKRVQRGRDRMRKELEQRIRKSVQELRPGRDTRLIENINLYTNFEIAGQLGQISLLEAMLVDGLDVNEPDALGRTLLHWAVENAHLEAVTLLLKNGADQNLRDRDGRTARDIAQSANDSSLLVRTLDEYR